LITPNVGSELRATSRNIIQNLPAPIVRHLAPTIRLFARSQATKAEAGLSIEPANVNTG
jgi:hypothetical protein